MVMSSPVVCLLVVLVGILDQSYGVHHMGHGHGGHSHVSPGFGVPHMDTETVTIPHGDHVHQTVRQVPHLYSGNMGLGHRHHLGLMGGLGYGNHLGHMGGLGYGNHLGNMGGLGHLGFPGGNPYYGRQYMSGNGNGNYGMGPYGGGQGFHTVG